MRRMRIALTAGFALFLLVSVADAQVHEKQSGWHHFWHRVKLDWHRNHAWPQPFQYTDRQIVKNHWAAQTQKGWQIENTLTSDHFDDDTTMLSAAGEAKLRWILTHAPSQRRTVFVLLGADQDTTETRVDLVQQAVAQLLPAGPLPAVVRTNKIPHPVTGNYINNVWIASEKALLSPSLPASSGGGGGGG